MSFRSEPFLWIHLAGLAVLPLCLEVVWLGLAIAQSLLPFWVELIVFTLVGIVPVFWMQWNRPFDIFSLLVVAMQPQQLTLEQRRILSLFKTTKHRIFTVLAALVLLWVLWQLHRLAPLAVIGASNFGFPPLLGLLLAALGFAGSHLFLQVPVSVLGVILTGDEVFAATEPLAVEKIPQEFTILGFRVRQILPAIASEKG